MWWTVRGPCDYRRVSLRQGLYLAYLNSAHIIHHISHTVHHENLYLHSSLSFTWYQRCQSPNQNKWKHSLKHLQEPYSKLSEYWVPSNIEWHSRLVDGHLLLPMVLVPSDRNWEGRRHFSSPHITETTTKTFLVQNTKSENGSSENGSIESGSSEHGSSENGLCEDRWSEMARVKMGWVKMGWVKMGRVKMGAVKTHYLGGATSISDGIFLFHWKWHFLMLKV